MEDLTKYEKARIIGARALQISMGAPFMFEITPDTLKEINYNPVEIAKMEFEKDLIPITIKRLLPAEMKKSPGEERDILEDIYGGEEEEITEEGEEAEIKKEEAVEDMAEEMAVDEEDDTV